MSTILKSFLIFCFSLTHGLFATEVKAETFLQLALEHYQTQPEEVKTYFRENALTTFQVISIENNQIRIDGKIAAVVVMESLSEKEIVFSVNGKKLSVLETDSFQDIARKIKPELSLHSTLLDFFISDVHAASGAAILVAVAAIIGIATYMAYSTFKKNETVELMNLTQEVCIEGAEALNRTFTQTEMVLAVKRYNELSEINKKHCQMKTTKGVNPKIIQACQSLKQSKKCLKDNVEVIDNSTRGSNKSKLGPVYIPSTDRFKEISVAK